jgi:hypothetical protein
VAVISGEASHFFTRGPNLINILLSIVLIIFIVNKVLFIIFYESKKGGCQKKSLKGSK